MSTAAHPTPTPLSGVPLHKLGTSGLAYKALRLRVAKWLATDYWSPEQRRALAATLLAGLDPEDQQ